VDIIERPHAGGFLELARLIALHKTLFGIAEAVGNGNCKISDPRVKSIVEKAVVSAGSTADASWAGNLVAYQILQSGFVESLRSLGAFDQLLPSMRRIPAYNYASIVTGGFVGHNIGEAAWKPISKLSISADLMTPQKAVAFAVSTAELLRFATAGTQVLFGDELRLAVAQTTDIPVIAALLAGLTVSASSGDPRVDIADLLASVPLKQSSRPFLLTSPTVVSQLAVARDSAGATLFPSISIPEGGECFGIPLRGVDSLSNYDGNGDYLVLVDASQCAGESDVITLDESSQADLQMTDSPTDAPEAMISMYGTDSVAIKAERFFNFAILRQSARAARKAVNYTVGSP
jgi:hypothetical protein